MGDRAVRSGRAKTALIGQATVAGVISVSRCSDTRSGPIGYSETFSAIDAPTVVPLESGYKIPQHAEA